MLSRLSSRLAPSLHFFYWARHGTTASCAQSYRHSHCAQASGLFLHFLPPLEYSESRQAKQITVQDARMGNFTGKEGEEPGKDSTGPPPGFIPDGSAQAGAPGAFDFQYQATPGQTPQGMEVEYQGGTGGDPGEGALITWCYLAVHRCQGASTP